MMGRDPVHYRDDGPVAQLVQGCVQAVVGVEMGHAFWWQDHAKRAFAFAALPDAEALQHIYDVLIHEGLSVGTSSGINIAAAVRVAKQLGPGHTVVTILADGGSRYQSKLFNPEFLRSKNLPVPGWMA